MQTDLNTIDINDSVLKEEIERGERSLTILLLKLYEMHVRLGEDRQTCLEVCYSLHTLYSAASSDMDALITLEEEENNMAERFAWIKFVIFFLLMIFPSISQWGLRKQNNII